MRWSQKRSKKIPVVASQLCASLGGPARGEVGLGTRAHLRNHRYTAGSERVGRRDPKWGCLVQTASHPRPRPACPREERPGGDHQEREPPSSALHYTTRSGTQCSPGPALPVTSPGEQEHPAPSPDLRQHRGRWGGGAPRILTPVPQRFSAPSPARAGGASGHNPSRTHSTQPTALPSTCSIGWSRIVTQSCLPHLVLFPVLRRSNIHKLQRLLKKKKGSLGAWSFCFPFHLLQRR